MGFDLIDTIMTATIEDIDTSADIEVAFGGDTFSGVVYLVENAFPVEGKRTSKQLLLITIENVRGN